MGLARYFSWFGLPGTLVLTALLSLFALTLACLFPSVARWLCAAGMLCSSLGDILLMNYRPITDRLPFRGFAAGAVAFMAAHACYIAAFLAACGGTMLTPALGVGAAIFVAMLALLICLYRKNARANRSRMLLCLTYLVVISACLTSVFTYGWHHAPIGAISAVGALLFFASDVIIGFAQVGDVHIPHANDWIWWLYPLGQLLLIGGLWV